MKISIKNLTFKCIIGILDFERVKKQRVIIDISFKYDFKDQKNFIDYSQIAKKVEKTMKKKKFLLIEDALLHLENKLYKKYPIKSLKIKITKPNIMKNCEVSVAK